MNWTMGLLLALAAMQVAQAFIILGLLRQVGLLHLRIHPAGARTLPAGPALGEALSPLELPDLEEANTLLKLPPTDGRA